MVIIVLQNFKIIAWNEIFLSFRIGEDVLEFYITFDEGVARVTTQETEYGNTFSFVHMNTNIWQLVSKHKKLGNLLFEEEDGVLQLLSDLSNEADPIIIFQFGIYCIIITRDLLGNIVQVSVERI